MTSTSKKNAVWRCASLLAWLALTLAVLSQAGCVRAGKESHVASPAITMPPAAAGTETALVAAAPAARTDGSIWPADRPVNFFSDDKAWNRGDLVQVHVLQRSIGTKKANTNTRRSSTISAKIKYLFGLEDEINDLTGYTNKGADGAKGDWNPNNLIEAESSNTFKGEGTTERADVLEATVSAIVTEVMANGNLVIHGRQVVALNNEQSVLTVEGIVRPSDISQTNTIDSTRIADARIEFSGTGAVSDKQRPGWGIRVFDRVWPF